MILDGEIVALDAATGRPSFNALQNRRAAEDAAGDRRRAARSAGRDVVLRPAALRRHSTCAARRTSIGAATCRNACCRPRICSWCTHRTMPRSSTPRRSPAASKASSRSARTAPISPASARPPGCKIKATQTAEFVVGGYTKGKGAREALGALLLGYWSGSKLHYAGHVGSGLDRRRRRGPAASASRNSSARRRRSSRSRRCIGRRPGSSPSWSSK